MNTSLVKELFWDFDEENQLTATAFGGRYVIFEISGALEVVWMFAKSFRQLEGGHGVLSVDDAKIVAQNDFDKIVSDSVRLN